MNIDHSPEPVLAEVVATHPRPTSLAEALQRARVGEEVVIGAKRVNPNAIIATLASLLVVAACGTAVGLGGNLVAGAIGAFLLGAVVFMYPPAAAWAMFVVAPFIIGFARGQFIPDMRLNEPMVGVLVVALALHALFYSNSLKFRVNRLDVAVVLVMLTGSIVPLLIRYGRLKELSGGDFLYAMAPVKFTIAYLICRAVIRTERDLDLTLKLGLIAASIVSLIAMADSMNIGGFAYTLANYVPSGEVIIDDGRGGSTFGNPIGMGVYAAINALIALAYFSLHRGGVVLMRIAFALCIGGVIGSGQVTGIIALTVGVCAFAVVNGDAIAIVKRLTPMILLATILLWPLIAQRLDQFDGYEVSSTQRQGVEFSAPEDQPQALWELNPGSSWDYRMFNLRTYFFPEFQEPSNVIFGVRPEGRVAAPELWREWVWIEAGYVWLLWIGGIPYVLAFLGFVVLGLYEFKKAARRNTGLSSKIAGVVFSGIAILAVVQGFDPHLTLRGTADILFPLMGTAGFLVQPLRFWKNTSLDRSPVANSPVPNRIELDHFATSGSIGPGGA